MFTGIVTEVGRVILASSKKLEIAASKIIKGIEAGNSIAVNGACLTVTDFNIGTFNVDIMPETLERTNFKLLQAGDEVNLERALSPDGLLGGHLVQGHVDATGKIISINKEGGATIFIIEAPPEVMRYIIEQGFITVDGISLTVAKIDKGKFVVSVVNYTFKNTNLHRRQAGDVVNLEADIIGKYIEQLGKRGSGGITLDYLGEHGFLMGE